MKIVLFSRGNVYQSAKRSGAVVVELKNEGMEGRNYEREEAEAAGIYTTDLCVAKEKIIRLQSLGL